MPRYVAERTFAGRRCRSPPTAMAVRLLGAVVDQNGEEGVILVRSFLGEDRTYTFCIFDAPDPGANPQVRESQRAAGRPDHQGAGAGPYFYA